jgi:F-box-like
MSSHPSALVDSTVSSILIDGSSGGLEMGQEQQIAPLTSETVSNNRGQGNVSIFCLTPTMTTDLCSADQMTIDVLPDDVLLEIFSLCGEANRFDLSWWKTYVHVCRRWRQVIFASPLHLRLVLDCNPKSPVRRSLNIWPPLPIVIRYSVRDSCGESEETMAAFEHHGHVSEISIYCPMSSEWKKFAMAMLGPFPALTSLVLVACGALVPVLPETFLGGSAPSLRTLILDRIPFPALPKLLSSATRLVSFRVWNVPGTGYISPEAIAACLAALPCLEEFRIETQTGPLADERSPPPPTPAVLPSLTLFHCKGIIGYLEHLIARTDSPRLTTLSITFYGLILHIPQLHRFIGCASNIKTPNCVVVEFYFSMVNLKFMPSDSFTLSMMQDN